MPKLHELLWELEGDVMLRDNSGEEWSPLDYLNESEASDDDLDQEVCVTGNSDGKQVRLVDGEGYIVDNCEPLFWIINW